MAVVVPVTGKDPAVLILVVTAAAALLHRSVRATEAGPAKKASTQDLSHFLLLLLGFQSSVDGPGKARNLLALSPLPFFPGPLYLSSFSFHMWTTLTHSKFYLVIIV